MDGAAINARERKGTRDKLPKKYTQNAQGKRSIYPEDSCAGEEKNGIRGNFVALARWLAFGRASAHTHAHTLDTPFNYASCVIITARESERTAAGYNYNAAERRPLDDTARNTVA